MIVEARRRTDQAAVAERRPLALDAIGAAALLTLAGWTFASAARWGADPIPHVAMLLGSCGLLLVARLLASFSRRAVPLTVVTIAAVLLLRDPSSVLSSAPRAGPFGFSSITGAFFLQAAIGALMLFAIGGLGLRMSALVGFAAFGWVTVATHTCAAAILLVALGAGAWIARSLGTPKRAIGALAGLVVVAVAVTIELGAVYNPDRSTALARVVDATVTERRQALWHDALVLTVHHPLFGVGPGRFGVESPVARSDPDEPWAHEELLQESAELGLVGGLLLAGLFAWCFVRLSFPRHPDAVSVLGAVALAALGVHACIEYVLQRPAVPFAAAALVGTAIGPFRLVERARGRHAAA